MKKSGRRRAASSGLDAEHRIELVYFFDVKDGNPNGDPDAANMPRLDPETGQGLVSDVALKRKIRDYVAVAKKGEVGFNIYVQLMSALHEKRAAAWTELGLDEAAAGRDRQQAVTRARAWMCENYFDVRAFGAVMRMNEFNCGQVRGPMQLAFARSVDPITILEQTVVRKAVEKADAEKQLADQGEIIGTMGRKAIVPYALYRCHIFYNPMLARQTGFGQDDLELTFDALKNMFEIDRTSHRGEMSSCRIVAFQHDRPLGCARASELFDLVAARRRTRDGPARAFSDYAITVDGNAPSGVQIHDVL